jgi:hypothetical protein
MNADGGGKENLTSTRKLSDGCPDWSPDGTRTAFSSERDGDSDICTMDADGSDVARVTNLPGDEACPDWQPLTSESRSMTVLPPDTGGTSSLLLSLVASALLFSVGVLLYAVVWRRM